MFKKIKMYTLFGLEKTNIEFIIADINIKKYKIKQNVKSL